MALLKKIAIAALPDVAPKSRRTGLGSTIADMEIGDAGVVMYNPNVVRNAAKSVAETFLNEHGEARFYLVWPCDENGTLTQPAKGFPATFALIARLDREDYFKRGGHVSGETE